jgi:hypothetical protein
VIAASTLPIGNVQDWLYRASHRPRRDDRWSCVSTAGRYRHLRSAAMKLPHHARTIATASVLTASSHSDRESVDGLRQRFRLHPADRANAFASGTLETV